MRGTQVYSIVACQLALTAVVAAIIMFNQPVQKFVLTNTPFQIINTLLPFLGAVVSFASRVLQDIVKNGFVHYSNTNSIESLSA